MGASVSKKEALIRGVMVGGFQTRWIVRRPFKDGEGMTRVGDVPPPERVAKWVNLDAMRSLGMIEIWDGDDDEADEKAKADQPKLEVVQTPSPNKTAPEPKMCPQCGRGPFVRLNQHISRAHKKEKTDE